jgi:3-oxoacyl-[acyl-carrier protein] reductase
VEELAAAGAKQGGTTPDAIRAKWEAQIPMGRLGEPREFAALAAFLASDRASYITAQNIAVDGGWVRALV